MNRTKNNYFEDNEEDEDLVWEAEEEQQAAASNTTDASSSTKSNPVSNAEDKQKIRELENENDQLKRQVHLLLQRVADLELELSKVKPASEPSSSAYSSYEDVRKAEVIPTVVKTLSPNRQKVDNDGAASPSPVLVSPVNSPRTSSNKPAAAPAVSKPAPTTATNTNATTIHKPATTSTATTAPPAITTTATQSKPSTTTTGKSLFELNEDDEDGWT